MKCCNKNLFITETRVLTYLYRFYKNNPDACICALPCRQLGKYSCTRGFEGKAKVADEIPASIFFKELYLGNIIIIILKRFLQILLFIFYTTVCHAQQHAIDSFNRLITKATSDTQRINLNIEKAYALININSDSSIQLYNKVIQESNTFNYKQGELRSTLDLAAIYAGNGDTILSKKMLSKASEFLKTIKDSTAVFDYYIAYGRLCNSEGKNDSSLIFFKKALAVIPTGSINRKLAYTYSLIGDVYSESADVTKALVYYQKGISNGERVSDEYHEAYIYSQMAGIHYEIGDTVKAEQDFLYTIKLAEKISNVYFKSSACYGLSNLYIQKHKYTDAYNYAINGADLAKTIANQEIESSCLSNAAVALAKLNKFNEAENLCRKAIIIADSSKQSFSISASYSSMGDILRMEGKYKEAIPYYEKSSPPVNSPFFMILE